MNVDLKVIFVWFIVYWGYYDVDNGIIENMFLVI